MKFGKNTGEGSGSGKGSEPRSAGGGLDDDQLAMIEQHEAEVALLQAPPSRTLERGIGIALIVLSLLGVYGSQTIAIRNNVNELFGPRWWPTALCVLSLALSIALTIGAFIRPPFEREGIERSNREGWQKLVITLIVEALFIVFWSITGNFIVTGAIMLAVMLWFYGTRNWKMLIAFPVATIALIYALFALLLNIPL